MTETPAQRELALQVARLDREAKHPIDLAVVHCTQHGPQYTCPNAHPTEGYDWAWAHRGAKHTDLGRIKIPNGTWNIHCGHIACRQITANHCPECETP